MNKTELVAAIAEKTSLSQADAKKALNAALEAMTEALTKKENIALVGFGTFSVQHKEARMGVNPSNGQKIEIPARDVVKFKAGGALK